jgi:hypothetical protein
MDIFFYVYRHKSLYEKNEDTAIEKDGKRKGKKGYGNIGMAGEK